MFKSHDIIICIDNFIYSFWLTLYKKYEVMNVSYAYGDEYVEILADDGRLMHFHWSRFMLARDVEENLDIDYLDITRSVVGG